MGTGAATDTRLDPVANDLFYPPRRRRTSLALTTTTVAHQASVGLLDLVTWVITIAGTTAEVDTTGNAVIEVCPIRDLAR